MSTDSSTQSAESTEKGMLYVSTIISETAITTSLDENAGLRDAFTNKRILEKGRKHIREQVEVLSHGAELEGIMFSDDTQFMKSTEEMAGNPARCREALYEIGVCLPLARDDFHKLAYLGTTPNLGRAIIVKEDGLTYLGTVICNTADSEKKLLRITFMHEGKLLPTESLKPREIQKAYTVI